MLLDASKYQTFVIDFRSSVSMLTIKNIWPGMLYVFILRQDSQGGHTLTWADNFENATQIDTTPKAVTVQMFIAAQAGILYSVPRATYYQG